MDFVNELKSVIEIKIDIKEDVLAQKLFDQAVDPLMIELVKLIPTEIDDVFYKGKKEELRALFISLIKGEVNKIETKIDEVIS